MLFRAKDQSKLMIRTQNFTTTTHSAAGHKQHPHTTSACSLGLSATSQQYFSLTTNQPPATSQQYYSLRTNQHQPSATSQPNKL
jgi:hypothetical protein